MSNEKYRVVVKLKEGVLDVQGKAIESSVSELGVDQICDVRVGRVIEFSFPEGSSLSKEQSKEHIEKMCVELFSNPVIENYTWEQV